MKVLVTGADGLLGSNIVRVLLEQNYEVKTFVLPNSTSTTLNDLPIEIFKGNILEPDTIDEAIHDCDMVIHAAAITDTWPSRSKITCRVNIEGTENMVAAVRKHNIKRLVYISSASSFDAGTKENPGTETSGFTGYKYELDYIDSKRKAQEYVEAEAKNNGLPAIIVNPTFMLGPHDSKPSAGEMILGIYHGKVPGCPAGGKNFVYVKDVATAAVNALKMGRIGECYIAGHINMSYKEAFKLIANEVGVKAPSIVLPPTLMLIVGKLVEGIANLRKVKPTFSYVQARIGNDGHYFSPAKAVKELNMPQTDMKLAVKEAFEWFETNDYL